MMEIVFAKAYIGFSIEGTNKFVIAVKKDFKTRIETGYPRKWIAVGCKLPGSFTAGISRRPGYNPVKDGIKLLWSELCTKKGEALREPHRVMKAFEMLRGEGWEIINLEEFKTHHKEIKRQRALASMKK